MSRSVTRMTIDDAEHISEEKRAEIIASYPPHEVEARTKGIPVLGSGRIYPVTEASIMCEPFSVPRHWAMVGGIDFGWDHPTAAVQIAYDRDTDIMYLGACYTRKEAEPLEHAATLKRWGGFPWAWPMDAYQRDKRSGGTLKNDYIDAGLNMMAVHATHPDGGVGVEAGLMEILTRMKTGRFKVFSHLQEWWDEFRLYHRKDGSVVKEYDDLMDATRYAVMMSRFAEAPDVYEGDGDHTRYDAGRSSATGY